MKKKQKKIQLTLISLGLLLFVLTYLYYPSLNKVEDFKDEVVEEKTKKDSDIKQSTSFENVEYKGLYNFDKSFKVQSKKALILGDDPDVVYLDNMRVIIYINENRTVEITSLKGRYNKINYNCYFEQDVIATDGEITITAENLDLLATNNFVEIYNNVDLNYTNGTLKADKIDYDFETKKFKVSMFDNKAVKMKVIQ